MKKAWPFEISENVSGTNYAKLQAALKTALDELKKERENLEQLERERVEREGATAELNSSPTLTEDFVYVGSNDR